MESIVFNQEELSAAISSGCKAICLCDNNYRIDALENTSFLAIGNVTASVSLSRAECEQLNMQFLNFTPQYLNKTHAFVPLKHSGAVNVGGGSFATSGGSFSSSYRLSGSYALAGSYRFMTSYASSYTTSYRFASSYRYVSSFASSFGTSFKLSSSFRSSFASSFADKIGSARAAGNMESDGGYIPVFGYGINLI